MSNQQRISRNFIRGAVVVHPNTLLNLAHAKKPVYHSGWNKILPAGFLMSMQFSLVMVMVRRGFLYNVKRLPDSLKSKCPWPVYDYNDVTGLYDKPRR